MEDAPQPEDDHDEDLKAGVRRAEKGRRGDGAHLGALPGRTWAAHEMVNHGCGGRRSLASA